MKCKRCGCTETTPCIREGEPCAWMLPNLCTACLTPEEAAIDKAYAGIIEGLRVEKRFHQCLLAVAQGMAANAALNIETCEPRAFVMRAFELASALTEAADTEADDEDEADQPSGIVLP